MSAPAASPAGRTHPARPRLLHRPLSPAQREAARRNGARSRGPRTAAGKAHSSRNAHRHGLYAKLHLFTAEETQALHDQVRYYVDSMRPRDPVSDALVRRLAFLDFQRRRVWDLDSELFAAELEDPLALIPKSAAVSQFACRYFHLFCNTLARLGDIQRQTANGKSNEQTQELAANKELAPENALNARPSPRTAQSEPTCAPRPAEAEFHICRRIPGCVVP